MESGPSLREGDAGGNPTGAPSGPPPSAGGLFLAIYDDLRGIAAARLAGERGNHTLQPTALVHETYLRLIDQDPTRWNDRRHMLAIAAIIMRRILVDHARRHIRKPAGLSGRGGESVAPADADHRVDVAAAATELQAHSAIGLVDLDALLERIGAEHPRWRQVVELRFFAGLSVEETAEVLDVSTRTVELDWRAARACLQALIKTKTSPRSTTAS